MKSRLAGLCAVAGCFAVGQAWAATTWTLNTGTVSSGGYSVTSTGWANTGTGASADNYTLQAQPAGSNMTLYPGGLGINNLDGCSTGTSCDVGDLAYSAPEHAIDNQQRYEMVLLSFSSLVNLTSFNIGWKGTDSDMTVLAYTGAGTPASLSGQKWSDVKAAASGWSLIGHYGDVGTASAKSTGSATYSSFWLIGAYNPLAALASTAGNINNGDDYIKLSAVTGNVCLNGNGPSCTPGNKVPEPGSMALLGLGVLGMMGLRRRARG